MQIFTDCCAEPFFLGTPTPSPVRIGAFSFTRVSSPGSDCSTCTGRPFRSRTISYSVRKMWRITGYGLHSECRENLRELHGWQHRSVRAIFMMLEILVFRFCPNSHKARGLGTIRGAMKWLEPLERYIEATVVIWPVDSVFQRRRNRSE